jgi:hypothetical protein
MMGHVFHFHQVILIVATIVGSWLGMQAAHELGHVMGAWMTGGQVSRVVLDPLTISRTDLSHNPAPGFVVWAGPVAGVMLPLAAWMITAVARMPGAFVLRFFAGFCLIANGLYIGIGSFGGVGDCGEMLRHGSQPWQLWLFGLLTAPFGLWLWHGQGKYFGFGPSARPISRGVAYGTFVICMLLLLLGFLAGR